MAEYVKVSNEYKITMTGNSTRDENDLNDYLDMIINNLITSKNDKNYLYCSIDVEKMNSTCKK